MKQTKIIATMGPASSSEAMIEKLIHAGVNVFRLNFSHGTHEFHAENIQKIRSISNKLSTPIGIMGDLQGPKIRVSKFENNQVESLLKGELLEAVFRKINEHNIQPKNA